MRPSLVVTGFVPYAGEGYALLLPAKWNPSKEFDFPGVALRCSLFFELRMPVCRPRWCRAGGVCAGSTKSGDECLLACCSRFQRLRMSRSHACMHVTHTSDVCRYEDNFDAVTNLTVITQKTDKSSITGYGSPEKFLNEFKFLLGTQVFTGELLCTASGACVARTHSIMG